MILRQVLVLVNLSAVCLLGSLQAAMAQDDIDNQLWVNYSLTVPIDNKLTLGGDTGGRGLISNYDWNQFHIRPNITYRLNYVFRVQQAVAWFGTFNRDVSNSHELRSHQDLKIKWPDFGFMEFFYRIRFEQRWFFYQDPDFENIFNLRVRGLFGIETADIRLWDAQKPIYFQGIFEWFSTNDNEAVTEVFVNRTRVHFAFGHRAWDRTRYELHYIRQGSKLYEESGLQVDTNIFRIRFYHWINRD